MTLTHSVAMELLHGLVSIPSVSREEAAACTWLVTQMRALGYDRAFVDAVGNAVGEMGPPGTPRTVVLLGHIDTVPGDIPVRVEEGEGGPLLHGRGSVDAKGPLATFTAAAASLGRDWAAVHGLRLVVVGAVEEEAATSKGARFIRDRFNGREEPLPTACIIGEPSDWRRVTLGYKGRILVELEAGQPMAHTAGPDAGVATVAVDFWNWIADYAGRFNARRERAFDQFLPSLRHLHTATDDHMRDRVTAQAGIRLPLDFDIDGFVAELVAWATRRIGASAPAALPPISSTRQTLSDDRETGTAIDLAGPLTAIGLRFYAHEPAWRSERNTPLVRSFLAAIREIGEARPGFVLKTGTSDMNVVAPAWGCPVVAYGPGDSSLDHTPHEHISLDEYWRAVQVLGRALEHLEASTRQTADDG